MGNTLIINGFDFEPFLSDEGIVYKRNDVDSADAGELADGTMRRNRVIVRPTLDIKITNKKRFIDDTIAHAMAQALDPQWLNVTFFDIRKGRAVTERYYTNNVTFTLEKVVNGKRKWNLADFTLVAKGIAGDGKAPIE